ncbi:MAG: proline--tRNA ligase [Ilumatobacteraceae bacterium]|jgi:prolyl-tRNA synthetase|nr:proline--tRNA ligase [Ilumatobacteraceae bacterium]
MLRLSHLFVRTLRDDPSDAEVPSHRLLVRAGYIRRAAPGGYTWLPLGWRVLRKVENIVREEMDAIGAQEVHFPALLPRDVYEATGRWTEYGDNLFRLVDRKGADYLLGPTHEEMFTLLVKDLYSSYKDLPVSLYQIQTKYRDEARPRAGLLRGREFLMKDSYSFDIDDAGLAKSYTDHRDAYERIFTRLGLPYVIVKAMSGAMGGSMSEEFLAPIEVGEDTFVRCTSCDYAANTEAVATGALAPDTSEHPATSTLSTPNCPTIASLVEYLNTNAPRSDRTWNASDTLKNVVLTLRNPDGTTSALVVGVPGDREVDIKRIEAQVSPAEVEPMDDATFAKNPGLVRGYIGPQVLGADSATGIRYMLDPSVVPGSAWVTGANQKDTHVLYLVNGRDFTADGTIEAVEVAAGDPCPNCGKALEIARGIEIGHVFQLGRKYADKLGLSVLDQNGKQVVVTMGSYGVGVSRAVASIAEAFHDDIGLKWPRAISPVDVHIVVTGKNGDDITVAGEQLAKHLEAQGLDVILDDRNGVSPGVKFKDAELMGIPTIVVVGKSLADGNVEVRDRHAGTNEAIPVASAVQHVVSLVRS